MAKSLLLLACSLVLLSLFSTSKATHGYFPDWSNCDSDPKIDFIDFYLDHKPTTKHSVNTITFCAGAGKENHIGSVNVKIASKDSNELMNETYPSLEGLKFTNGMYKRCFQAGIKEFTQPGDYVLTLIINSQGKNSTQIGCIQANWTVNAEQLSYDEM